MLSCVSKWLRGRAFVALRRIAGGLSAVLRRCLPPVVGFLKRYVIPVGCFLLCIAVLLGGFACIISAAVCHKTGDRIVSIEQLSEMEGEFDCIFVLGCRVLSNGTPSAMLDDRISTAVMLYQNGVSERILMSGDSRTEWYDETGTMKSVAIAKGVPAEAILTDPMGLSTYDSLARLLRVWEGKRVVIVTQEYHLYRSLYIAEKLGIEAYGVSADMRPYAGQIKYDLREILARCKDVLYALKKPTPAGLADAAQ
jgi:vancomycin permeability regulator SanA